MSQLQLPLNKNNIAGCFSGPLFNLNFYNVISYYIMIYHIHFHVKWGNTVELQYDLSNVILAKGIFQKKSLSR